MGYESPSRFVWIEKSHLIFQFWRYKWKELEKEDKYRDNLDDYIHRENLALFL